MPGKEPLLLVPAMEELRARWLYLYQDYLPALARAKDPVQSTWPVDLDHCFGRIILDNAVGREKPWTAVVKAPAVRNMNTHQLRAAISLAEDLVHGLADLEGLNARSLELRQNNRARESATKKRKAVEPDDMPAAKKQPTIVATQISSYFQPKSRDFSTQAPKTEDEGAGSRVPAQATSADHLDDMAEQLKRIESSVLTPFRKLMLRLLCQIPRGRYSTYQAMADHVTQTSHKSCARAVGNAMRNNPFAPEVPCHRVLATGGRLGGFGGSWGEDGKHADAKHKLLNEEGVVFDSRGIVKGPPFRDFH